MNAAGIKALEQSLGYHREGIKSATRRVQEFEKSLADARAQLDYARNEVEELEADLAAVKGVES